MTPKNHLEINWPLVQFLQGNFPVIHFFSGTKMRVSRAIGLCIAAQNVFLRIMWKHEVGVYEDENSPSKLVLTHFGLGLGLTASC